MFLEPYCVSGLGWAPKMGTRRAFVFRHMLASQLPFMVGSLTPATDR